MVRIVAYLISKYSEMVENFSLQNFLIKLSGGDKGGMQILACWLV